MALIKNYITQFWFRLSENHQIVEKITYKHWLGCQVDGRAWGAWSCFATDDAKAKND